MVMPGSGRPTEPGLAGPLARQAGAGGRRLGHAPAAAEALAGQLLEALGYLHRQRRAARGRIAQRGEIALVDVGRIGERDPHGGHAGEHGRLLDLDVVERRGHVEAHAQQQLVALAQAAQQHRGERVDVEQRQHADDLVLAGRGDALRIAPGLVDRARGAEIAVGQHGALGLAGGAAGVLQQRDVIDVHLRPLRAAASLRRLRAAGRSARRARRRRWAWWVWPTGRRPCRRRR